MSNLRVISCFLSVSLDAVFLGIIATPALISNPLFTVSTLSNSITIDTSIFAFLRISSVAFLVGMSFSNAIKSTPSRSFTLSDFFFESGWLGFIATTSSSVANGKIFSSLCFTGKATSPTSDDPCRTSSYTRLALLYSTLVFTEGKSFMNAFKYGGSS